MEFNSQVCTTKEQSERLLSLGLKWETADCFLEYVGVDNYGNKVWHPSTIVNNFRMPDYSRDIPAWSLHRLIEILNVWILDINLHNFPNAYEFVIAYFEAQVKGGLIKKEYLE